jgi:hypothetical protein
MAADAAPIVDDRGLVSVACHWPACHQFLALTDAVGPPSGQGAAMRPLTAPGGSHPAARPSYATPEIRDSGRGWV